MPKSRAKTRPKTRRLRGSNRAVVRAVRDWLEAGQLESALGWIVHEASEEQRTEIAGRSLAITESVSATYGVTDETMKFTMSERITAAITLDAMAAGFAEPGEVPGIGAELDKTLAAMNRDLSRKAGFR